MKRFAGLSLVLASQFVLQASLLFAFPSSVLSVLQLSPLLHTALFTTMHMSVAWRRGGMGMCNVSVSCEWDKHGQLVGRSVDACVPIDHASVGLTHARPNEVNVKFSVYANLTA